MRHLTVLRLAVPVAAALLVAGCTDKSSGGGASASPTVGLADTAEPVWTVQAQLMNQPNVEDGVALAYVAQPDTYTLDVVAWDVKDGTELWRHEAAPGNDVPAGVSMVLDATESDGAKVVPYLVGDDSTGGTLLAVADLKTGTETRFGPAVWATGRPSVCDDTGVCLEGTFSGERTAHQIRLDEASATLVPSAGATGQPLPDNARWIGNGVFATNDREAPAEQLGYSVDGAVQWTRPYQEVFGPYTSSDGGWTWHRYDSLLVGVGNVSGTLVAGLTLENPTYRTVALEVSTGQTLWSTPGAPCGWDWPEKAEVLAICQETGTVTVNGDLSSGFDLDYADRTQHVVGIDLQTGEQRWRFPAQGEDPAVPDDGFPTYAPMGDYLVAQGSDGPALVEVATGKVTTLASDLTYLCDAHRDGATVALRRGGRTTRTDDYGRRVLRLCGSDGQPAAGAPWPAFFVRAAGQEVDGLSVVAVGDQLVAFRL